MKWKIITGAIAFATSISVEGDSSIPNIPLNASLSVAPNLLLMLDDSGSMHFEVMPDNLRSFSYYMFPRAPHVYCEDRCGSHGWGLGGFYKYRDYANFTVDTDEKNRYARILRSYEFNKLYYNPKVRYYPWSHPDGSLWPNADPQKAYHNPADRSKGYRNLTVNNCYRDRSILWKTDKGYMRTRAKKCIYPATYFLFNPSCDKVSDKWKSECFRKIEIRPGRRYPKYPDRTDCQGSFCTYEEEIQNFANWYSYYRSRILAARAAIGRALAQLGENVRVGFGSLNKRKSKVDGVATEAVILGVRPFAGRDRERLFNQLYHHPIPQAWTPLRGALDRAGNYFRRNDDRGPWSETPGRRGGAQLACRQNYTILMTDGYWNFDLVSGGALRNNDGKDGTWHRLVQESTTPEDRPGFDCEPSHCRYKAEAPFYDKISSTLADVAMFYWKNDLRPDLENIVPTNALDPAFWQHMVTFGVGFGVFGSIDPEEAFKAIIRGTPIPWPNPLRYSVDKAKIDDLLHAAVNSRGGFFSAADPEALAEGLERTLQEIVERKGSAASITLTGSQVNSSTLVFKPIYRTGKWSGDLIAYAVEDVLRGQFDRPLWKASDRLPHWKTRRIYVHLDGITRPFLGSVAGMSEALVDYLRGDRQNELKKGGAFRDREHPLGDIVHSTPFFLKDNGTLFVGANDGMLHAFDARTGRELFAYIPSAVVSKLPVLADPNYSHEYYVDGQMDISSRLETGGRNILVAALGRGGRGLFALDVTHPERFGVANVLWEYFGGDVDPDLGYMVGEPIIAKLNNGSYGVIVANGYRSTSGQAVLYVFELFSGTLLKKIETGVSGENGLSTPAVVDLDDDGDIDVVYAGDLKGNVWKFDLRSTSPENWRVAYKLFTAKDSQGNPQPITAPLTVAINTVPDDPNYGKRYVFFGTGSYIFAGDSSSSQVQSWYGLIDEGRPILARSELKERRIQTVTRLHGKWVRTFAKAQIGDMVGKRGWVIDFPRYGERQVSERMIERSQLQYLLVPVLIGPSIVPPEDPCHPEGKGFINIIHPFTGGSILNILFDINEDGSFDQEDRPNREEYVGSVGIEGMPTLPRKIGNNLLIGTSKGEMVKISTPLIQRGRWMWREVVME